jgi:hypothetical protein
METPCQMGDNNKRDKQKTNNTEMFSEYYSVEPAGQLQ